MCLLYSSHVVAAIVRSVPRARAGLSRFAASPLPAAAAGANERVRFVDEQNDRLWRGLHFIDDSPQTFLEFAFHARAGGKQTDIERANATSFKAGGTSPARFDGRTLRRPLFFQRPLHR